MNAALRGAELQLSLVAWKCQQMPILTLHRIGIRKFQPISEGLWPIHAVAGQSTWICGTGEVYILMVVHGQWEPGVLHNVLYMPSFRHYLFSAASAAQYDIETIYTKTGCQLIHHGELVMEGVLSQINIEVAKPVAQAL